MAVDPLGDVFYGQLFCFKYGLTSGDKLFVACWGYSSPDLYGSFEGRCKDCSKRNHPVFLSFIGAFTDIVSYIRLFAVGLATVAVADANNTMAAQAPIAGKVVILFIGHSLNLILAAMAILVHGIRLNVLEFSGHLHLEWTGFQYAPFRNLKEA